MAFTTGRWRALMSGFVVALLVRRVRANPASGWRALLAGRVRALTASGWRALLGRFVMAFLMVVGTTLLAGSRLYSSVTGIG